MRFKREKRTNSASEMQTKLAVRSLQLAAGQKIFMKKIPLTQL
jgi:hypothetical protein